jgi:hypothetical protein
LLRRGTVPALLAIACLAGCPATVVVTPTPGPTSSSANTGAASPMPGFSMPPPSAPVTTAPAGKVRQAGVDPLPWAVPADVEARVRAGGMDPMAKEAFTMHIHTHLTVFVDGVVADVPGQIGIHPEGQFISPLHTHAADGYLHVEAPEVKDFFLWQAMAEWGVSLEGFTAYENGTKVTTDPGQIVLKDRHQLTLVHGKPPEHIPDTYPSNGP